MEFSFLWKNSKVKVSSLMKQHKHAQHYPLISGLAKVQMLLIDGVSNFWSVLPVRNAPDYNLEK